MTMPVHEYATLMPSGSRNCPIQPVGAKMRRERDAGDGGGKRERQVDDGIEHAPAREPVAHQHPGDDQSEHRVDRRRDKRRAKGDPKRGNDAVAGGDGPELVPRQVRRPQYQGRERDQDDQAEIGEREAERQPEAGDDARPPPVSQLSSRSWLVDQRLKIWSKMPPLAKCRGVTLAQPPNTGSSMVRSLSRGNRLRSCGSASSGLAAR